MSGAEIASELTEYFRQGHAALLAGNDRCPYYATSDAAEGWHAGFHYNGAPGARLNAGEIILATKAQGHGRVHLFGGLSLDYAHFIARIQWNDDDEHQAAVAIELASPMSSMKRRFRREIERRQHAGSAPGMSDRDRQLVELGAKAPLQSKGRPVADAGHLPLFAAANEPTLF